MTRPACADMGRHVNIFNLSAGRWAVRLAWAAKVSSYYIGPWSWWVSECFCFCVPVAELLRFRSPLNRGVAGAMDLDQRFTTAFNSIREAKREVMTEK